VPEVLLSGNHAAIAEWRRRKAIEATRAKRSDLLTGVSEGDSRPCAQGPEER
jgi:tRNA (guanine37-N1)-methyltransferase